MTSSNLNKKTEFFAVKVQLRSMPYIFGLAYGCVLTYTMYWGTEKFQSMGATYLMSPEEFLAYDIATYKGGSLGERDAYHLLDGAKDWAATHPHLLPELERRMRVLSDVDKLSQ